MSGRYILIVDDDSDIRQLVLATLRGFGEVVGEAESGDEAIALIDQSPPDLVLLDLMMPGNIDGLEVCRRIKADPRCGATRVVMLSAMGQSEDIKRGISAGADDYLVKPFSPLTLLSVLR